MSVPKTVHFAALGSDVMNRNPDDLTFHQQTEAQAKRAYDEKLHDVSASVPELQEAGAIPSRVESAYQQFDVREPHEHCNVQITKMGKASGLRLPKVKLIERMRQFFRGVANNQRDKLVTEGQDHSLPGWEDRQKNMVSKKTAVEAPKTLDGGYRALKGGALKRYNRFIDRMFAQGGKQAISKVESAQQKEHIANHIACNAEKLFVFFAARKRDLKSNQSLDPNEVSRLLKDMGFKSRATINNTKDLQAFMERKGAMSHIVWSSAEKLQNVKSKRFRAFYGQDHNRFFDHNAGGVVKKARLNGELQKGLEYIVQEQLDRPLERVLLDRLKGTNPDIARFSGNAYNLGLYGAVNKGLDGSRDAAFRIALRWTGKRVVADNLKTLQGPALEQYIRKLQPDLVSEFLYVMDQPDGDHEDLIRIARDHSEELDKLTSTYFSEINGPCGNLQKAGFEVGMVLSACQHVTKQTSLYCFHNGDFTDVSGLQSNQLTRTYMEIREGTQIEKMYKNHPEKKVSEKSGRHFIPIDCVHSQFLVDVPGTEEEASMNLRLIMADIIPDFEKLEVRIGGHSTMHNGADKPYTSHDGKKVVGCSRFANTPHLYDVKEGATEEGLIIEALEFVFKDENGERPIMISTQHHDDAEKGSHEHHDYSDDTALSCRHSHDDGAERTMMKDAIERSVKRHYGLPQTSGAEVNPAMEEAEAQQEGVISRLYSMFNRSTPSEHVSDEQRELKQLKEKAGARWLNDSAISNDDILRNADMFKAISLESSAEARLYEILMDGSPPRLPVSQAEIDKRIDDAFRQGLPDLHVLSEGFDEAADTLERFFKIQLEDRKTFVDGAMPMQRETKLFQRPKKGWQGAGNRVSSLPAGLAGMIPAPVILSQGASMVAASAPKLAQAGLATAAAVGTAATGAGLIAQGALMEKSAMDVSRRLGRISKEKQSEFNHVYQLWAALRNEPTIEADRNAAIEPLKATLPVATEQIGRLKQAVEANADPELAEHRQGIADSLQEVLTQLQTVANQDVLDISDLEDTVSSLAIAMAITGYLVDKHPSLNDVAIEAGTELRAQHAEWADLMETDTIKEESRLTTKLESLHTAIRDVKTAKKDNAVMRWSGRGYAASGGLFVASVTPAAAVLPLLGPIGSGILTAVYAGNFVNTVRDARRTAAADLNVHAKHNQPWAPKVVGFHRQMLARRAEQVEADQRKNKGLSWRAMGWGMGTAAMAGLTIAGAVTATVATAGIALPIILGVGVGLAVVLNASTYNLFNRHASRGATFGARPESLVHADGMSSNERKRSYWSLSKQLGQTVELKQNMLETLDKNNKKAMAARDNLYPMEKGAKSPLLDYKDIAHKTDARTPWMHFLEKTFRPNASRLAQAKAIKSAFRKDWTADVDHATYTFRLYSEHEINNLRDRAQSLIESHERLTRQIDSYIERGVSPDSDLVQRSRVERETLDDRIREVTGQMQGVKNFADSLEKFELRYDQFKKSDTQNLESDKVKDQFENLIIDFAHRMGVLGSLYSRGVTKQLAQEFPNDLRVETYKDFWGREHIGNIRCPADKELTPEFRARLKSKDGVKSDAFKHLANMLVFVLPDTLQYEIEKMFQTEIHGRKPSRMPTGVRV